MSESLQNFEALATTYAQSVDPAALQTLAGELGVSVESLTVLGTGYDGEAMTTPER